MKKSNIINANLNKPINPILIGKVGKSYGILGWITIFSFSEEKEKIFNYVPWFFFKEKKWLKINLDNWKKHKKNFIAKIKGISDRTEAIKLTNSDIMIDSHQLPLLKKNEYYWFEIISFKAFNTNQEYLGKIINLMRTKNNDILIIKNELKNYKKKILIPFIDKEIIKKIDIYNKIIIVQWDSFIYYK